ncbi:hypothetical protein [Bdellovibrio sp. KM01]|uniref:hypothetical protein n=1 Tax=Bdellovibrio sp. KM01 TaxID=2748865 RepID=UPI0015E94E1C|nr:hypothetical protein [Bdellovibrio sp. KM01]QLY25393.1 hypothetical protein HW988_18605 [Bdellovibrio sp. KM01]
MKLNFLLSLGIHGLLGAAFFFASFNNELPKKEVIQFEIQTPSTKQKLDFAGSAPNSARKSGTAAKIKGSNLNLFGSGYVADSNAKNTNEIERPVADYKDHANYIGDAEGFISDGNQWSYFQQVFKKIDEQLLFDSLLAQYGHFGNVYVEFEVDQKGHFVQSGLKVTADDAILKVHALRALIKGLRESFDKTKWNPTGKSQIFQAHFSFLYEKYGDNTKKQTAFAKPVLKFTRTTGEQAIPTNLQDQLLTGGLDYDLFAAAERWQKYNKRKKLRQQEFDPFSTYKSDPLYRL